MAAGFNSDLNFVKKIGSDDKAKTKRLDNNSRIVVDSHDVYRQEPCICAEGESR